MAKSKPSNLAKVRDNISLPELHRNRANTKLIEQWTLQKRINNPEIAFLKQIRYTKSYDLSDKQLTWEFNIHQRILEI